LFFMELVHDASVLIERMVLPSVGPGWNHGTECPVLCPHSRGVIRDGSKISRWGGRSSFCGGNGVVGGQCITNAGFAALAGLYGISANFMFQEYCLPPWQ
jgi:hypothetical protein